MLIRDKTLLKAMTAPGSPSLLARLRGTPGSLRRKFRKAHSVNISTTQYDSASTTSPTSETSSFKFVYTSKKHDENAENGATQFTCRFLGIMNIYTLKPEHCYGFAEGLAKAASELEGKEVNNNHSPNKCQIVVKEDTIEISPVTRRHHHHHMSRRKPNSTGTTPTGLKHHSPTLTRVRHFDRRPRTVSCDELISSDPTTVFYDSPHQISVLAPYANTHGQMPTIVDATSNLRYGREANLASMPENMQENFAANIPLHQVAYCVTVPSNDRLFLLTSRQGSCLVCRVFIFKLREKANALTLVLANQFKKNFLEWQRQRASATKRKVSIFKGNRQLMSHSEETTNASPSNPAGRDRGDSHDSGHEECVSEDCVSDMDSDERTNEELKTREYERRASCMDSPENISRRREMATESSGKYSDPTTSISDEFTTDDDSDQSEDNLFSVINIHK